MIRFILFAVTFAALNAYEMQKVFPNDPAASDEFGYGVGIQNDKAIIGSWGADSYTGAAYYFQNTVNNDEWIQHQKIVANDGVRGHAFGTSVAMDNDRVLISARGFNSSQGAVYVFGWNRTSSEWKEEAKLVANDGTSGDRFGGNIDAVALQNDRAVIGAYGTDSGKGSVYVFDCDSNTKEWSQSAKLTASDGQQRWFGGSVDIFGDTIIVGGTGNGLQNAYIFQYNGTKWEEIWILSAEATSVCCESVALYGDYALVGNYAQNAVYFFHYNQTSNEWNQTQKVSGNGQTQFGYPVRLTEQTAFIGADYGYNDNNVETGSVSIFRHSQNNGLWEETAKIAPEQGQASDVFSSGLQFCGNNVISGAWGDDTSGTSAGAAYIIRNHNSCNETRTEIIDESYLINWEWTVCYTLSPTVDPTVDPTVPSAPPTTAAPSTAAPSTAAPSVDQSASANASIFPSMIISFLFFAIF